jgi:hypothetical protein
MNTKGLDREEAAKEATKIYEQKSGKTIAEIRDERYSELLAFYEKEFGEVEKARTAANKAIKQEFGTPMYEEPGVLDTETTTTTTTETDVIKID